MVSMVLYQAVIYADCRHQASFTGGSSCCLTCRYFVAFFIDTSLGVGLAVGLHQLVVMVARIAASDCGTKTGLAAALARPGSYGGPCLCCSQRSVLHCTLQSALTRSHVGCAGDPVNKCVFCVQLSEFTIAVIIARAACGSLIILFRHQLIHGAAMLDRAFRGHPNILLLSVMVACPLLMNLLQALVQDTVLKRKHQPGKSSPVDQTPPSSELGDNTHLIPSRANSSCMDLC